MGKRPRTLNADGRRNSKTLDAQSLARESPIFLFDLALTVFPVGATFLVTSWASFVGFHFGFSFLYFLVAASISNLSNALRTLLGKNFTVLCPNFKCGTFLHETQYLKVRVAIPICAAISGYPMSFSSLGARPDLRT
jgi:hypothetical protein